MTPFLIKYLRFLTPCFDFGGGGGGTDNSGMNEAAKMNAEIAKEMWGEYQKTYLPMEQGFAADAAGYDSPTQRNKVASDAVATVGRQFDQQRDATARDMAAMGVNPTSGKWAAMERDSDLAGAAAKAGAANVAREGVKNMGWARKQDAISVGKGMPGTASSALAQAGNLYGQSAKLAADQNAAGGAAMGNIVAGGIAGYGIGKDFGWWRDGGHVQKRRFAAGGVALNPRIQAMLSSQQVGAAPAGRPQSSPVAQGINALKMGKNAIGLANRLAETGLAHGAVIPGVSMGSEQAAMLAAQNEGLGLKGLMATADAAKTAGAASAEMSAPAALSAAETAASAAAAAETTAAALTAAEAMAPEALAALFLLKDGGGVDVTDGGAVRGPGSETSDSIPAKISNNEFVLNADAVKLVGTDVLNRINDAGLAVRYGTKVGDWRQPDAPGAGVPNMAGGGLLNILGGAGAGLVAGAEIQRKRKTDAREEERLQMLKNADARSTEMHDVQLKSAKDLQAEVDSVRTTFSDWKAAREAAAGGDYRPALKEAADYNSQSGAYNDGRFIIPQSTEKGPVMNQVSASGQVLSSTPLNPQTAVQAIDAAFKQKLKFSNPTIYRHYEALEAAAQEKAAERASRKEIATGNNATSLKVAEINQSGSNLRHADDLAIKRGDLDIKRERLDIYRELGGLTLQQQRQNQEIDAAREAIAGLAPEEIKRRTSKSTDTGRENKDFDPALERAVRSASRRKIGKDDVFDGRQGRQPSEPKKTPKQAAAEALAADQKMAGYSLGEQTAHGFKVFDKDGRQVGFFGRQ